VVARTTCSIERKAALGAMFLRAGWWAGGRLAVFHCTLSVLLVENAAAAAPCIFAFFSRSAGSAADRGRPAESKLGPEKGQFSSNALPTGRAEGENGCAAPSLGRTFHAAQHSSHPTLDNRETRQRRGPRCGGCECMSGSAERRRAS
jgi:hypothetical protein